MEPLVVLRKWSEQGGCELLPSPESTQGFSLMFEGKRARRESEEGWEGKRRVEETMVILGSTFSITDTQNTKQFHLATAGISTNTVIDN